MASQESWPILLKNWHWRLLVGVPEDRETSQLAWLGWITSSCLPINATFGRKRLKICFYCGRLPVSERSVVFPSHSWRLLTHTKKKDFIASKGSNWLMSVYNNRILSLTGHTDLVVIRVFFLTCLWNGSCFINILSELFS